MFGLPILFSISSLFTDTYSITMALIHSYGYSALFVLMALEGSSLPIPSEVVVPLAGYLAAKGMLNAFVAFIAMFLGSVVGLAVDYYIGYFVGKDLVYKHLKFFHIKQHTLDRFDGWFAENGSFAVFITRFIPLVRTLISFPAGFAKMPQRKFFAYSMAGSFVWDAVLMVFGYYVLSVNSAVIVLGGIGVFVLALYLIYYFAMKRKKPDAHRERQAK